MMPPRRNEADQTYSDYEILSENESGISFERIPRQILDSQGPWFRRPKMINANTFPNTSYRIGTLEDIRKVLGRKELIDEFERGPFGHFLKWNPGTNSRKLLNCLISRAIFADQGIWFHIRGRAVEYTPQDHALITGLKFGPTQFDPRIMRDQRHSELFQVVCDGQNQRARWVTSEFKRSFRRFNDQDLVKLANLLMANFFILGRDPKSSVCPWLWHLIDDQAAFNNFPWGAYTYKTLLYYLRTFYRTGENYHYYGPAWTIMTWAFEVINGLGDMVAVKISETDVPRCLRWNFFKNFRDLSDKQLYEHFDICDDAIVAIQPNEREILEDYFLSIHQVGALLVKFHMPTSLYIAYGAPACPQADDVIEDENFAEAKCGTGSKRFLGDISEDGAPSSRQTRQHRDIRQGSSNSNASQEVGRVGLSRAEVIAIVEDVVHHENQEMMATFVERLREIENNALTLVKNSIRTLNS